MEAKTINSGVHTIIQNATASLGQLVKEIALSQNYTMEVRDTVYFTDVYFIDVYFTDVEAKHEL